jgi:hypothetical protein
MSKNQEDLFQWFLTNNIIPLITSAVIIALSWSSLGNQISLLNQKVDYLVQTQNEYFERNKEVQTRLGTMEVKIKELETMLVIK